MKRHDVIVIGGGPAGSTAASLLADKGWSVCLLEKAHHPRFHIGESLLPMNLPILEQLGVMEEIEHIGVKKYAAEFNSLDTRRPKDTFYFADSLTKNPPYAFQVRRSEFDFILLNNSRKKGVQVIEGFTVNDCDFSQKDSIKIIAIDSAHKKHEFSCRYVIDASGRDTFLSSKLHLKHKNQRHRMAAIYGHFENVLRRPGPDEGNISIYWFEHGWMWMIPLQNNVMSVGAVCWPDYLKTRTTDLNQFLLSTIAFVPEMENRMYSATALSPINAAANYSYSSAQMFGDDYLLVGDAYAFIDPVFSSGVYLAMKSSLLGTELVDSHLRDLSHKFMAGKNLESEVKRGLNSFSWFIYRFNAYGLRHLLMHNPGINASKHYKNVKAAVISVFAGETIDQSALTGPIMIFKLNYYLLFFLRIKQNFKFVKRWARTVLNKAQH